MNRFFKRSIKFIVIILAIILIPQSVNIQSELNMRVLITTMAIDLTDENEYELTAQVVIPSSNNESGSAEIDFVSAKASTITEAIERLSFVLGRTTGLSHISCIILGKKLTEENKTMQALDYFVRDRDVLNSSLLLISDKEAKEVLSNTKKLQLSSAVGLQKIFMYKEINCNGIATQLQEFFNEYFTESKTGYVSGIKIDEEKSENESGASSESGGSSGGSGQQETAGGGSSSGGGGSEKNGRINYNNSVYVFKEGELKTTITDDDSLLGVFLTNNNSTEGVVTIEDVNEDNIQNAKMGLYFRDKKVKFKTSFVDGKPKCKIKISTNRNEIYSIEGRDTNLELYKTQNNYLSDEVVDKFKDKMKECVLKAYTQAKDSGADLFKIGDMLYRSNAKEWKKLKESKDDNYLSEVDLDVEIVIKKQT